MKQQRAEAQESNTSEWTTLRNGAKVKNVQIHDAVGDLSVTCANCEPTATALWTTPGGELHVVDRQLAQIHTDLCVIAGLLTCVGLVLAAMFDRMTVRRKDAEVSQEASGD